jgi:hypothetical protein
MSFACIINQFILTFFFVCSNNATKPKTDATSAESDDLFLQPHDLKEHFAGKRFREGSAIAAVGQVCYWWDDPDPKVTGKRKKTKRLGTCFCTIEKISGADWTVRFHDDGKSEMLDYKRFTLAHQKGQELVIGDVLYENAGYGEDGLRLTKSEEQTKRKATKITPMNVKRSRTRRKVSVMNSQSVAVPVNKTGDVDVVELAVAAVCAATAPADPDREDVDNAHLRIGSAYAGDLQIDNLPDNMTGRETKTKAPRWIRCKAGPLTSDERARLGKFASVFKNPRKGAVCYQFAERAMQEYKGLQKSSLHLNSANVFGAAIGQVMTQVRPKEDLPFKGKVRPVHDLLYRMCREVFKIKDPKVVENKGGWIKKILRDDTYTFQDCDKHPEVMAQHVQQGIRDGPPPKVRNVRFSIQDRC